MHLYPFWIRFYTNALFDLCTNPFISSYVASPLIQARASEQLGTTVPDSLHKQFVCSKCPASCSWRKNWKWWSERSYSHSCIWEGKGQTAGLNDSIPPLSHTGAALIFTLPIFSSNQLCFVAIACEIRSVTTNHCSSTSKYIPQEMHQLDVLNNSLPKSQCLWTY